MGIVRTVAKNTFFYFLNSAADLLVNMMVGIALARSLGPDSYGSYSYLTWVLGLGIVVTSLGIGNLATRFIAEGIGKQDRGEVIALARSTLFFRCLAALVALVVLVILSIFGGHLLPDGANGIYLAIIGFALLPNTLMYLLTSIFAGFQRYDLGAYVLLGSSPLRGIIVVILAVLGFGIGPLLIANMIGWVLGLFIGIFLLRRLIPLKSLISAPPLSSATKRSALKFAVAVTAVQIVGYLLWQQAEVLFLGIWCPAKQIGFYRLACQLPTIVTGLVPSVFAGVLLPTMSEQFGKGDMEKIKVMFVASSRYLMIMGLPLAISVIALARPLANMLWGPEYGPTIELMQIVSVPFFMYAINGACTSVIYTLNKPSFDLKAGVVLACLSVGLDLWLIPRYGVLGAAIGSSIPRLLVVPIYSVFVSRNIQAVWPLADTAKIALASCIMGLGLYTIQTHMGTVPSIVLSIPAGLLIYGALLFGLRIVQRQDLQMFGRLEESLPPRFRKTYSIVIGVAMKAVR
jgi:O-antigen/teichoic acid export membrane protein